MSASRPYTSLSLWLEQAGDLAPRDPLPGPIDVDVAIVGAGFTGLWSAYYLAQADPSLRIAVLEREIAGYGASGRNGGWCYGHLNGSLDGYAARSGRDRAVALLRESCRTVDVIGAVLDAEGIDAGFVKSGALTVARTPGQARALRAGIEDDRRSGFGAEHARWLPAGELTPRVAVAGALGAKLEPACARVQPARLARGLADAVERRGVAIYEQTEVTGIEPGRVRTARGDVHAELVVRGTEGYTTHIPTEGRRIQPITSQIVATEPLGADVWAALGWGGRELLADALHLGVYCQRTVDDRIAIGGRGGFLPRGRGRDEAAIRNPRVFRALRAALRELFPAAGSARITHEWGGVWGAARDWMPTVGFEPQRGVAWAGGYGDGVCASNLAARTITDLLLRRDTDLVSFPWVNHRAPSWPPDPLPRVGARLVSSAYGLADEIERRRGRSPGWVALVDRVSRLADK
jgi:glycine/D-amino acid oxidase-like deaminating enzyme